MDYKLAKQLKDAGFPQNKEYPFTHFCCMEHNQTPLCDCNYRFDRDCASQVKIPSLLELVGACEHGFRMLRRVRNKYKNRIEWWGVSKGFKIMGSTPEEAVALLWLELNKK